MSCDSLASADHGFPAFRDIGREPYLGGNAPRFGAYAWTVGAILAIAIPIAVFLIGTRYGIGVTPDSTRYMGMNDVPYDAPLYAWLLMLLAHMGLSMAAAAKLAGFVLAGLNGGLTWHLLAKTTGRLPHTAIGTALVILSPQFVDLHASALSEPLFLFFILAICLAFLRYLDSERTAWLAACGVLVGLCALVRFTAPPIGMALAATILISRRHPLRRRIADAALLALVGGGLFLAWCVASELTADQSLGRELRFHGNMGILQWQKSLETIAAWLLPDMVPLALRVGLLAIALVAGTHVVLGQASRAVRETRRTKMVAPLLPMTLGLFFIAYLAFMVLATSIEANLALTGRYAFPPYVAAVLMVTIAVTMPYAPPRRASRITPGLAGLAAVMLVGDSARSGLHTAQYYREGKDFAALVWTQSPTLRRVKALSPDADLWSNAPDAVAYGTGRPTHWLPAKVQSRTGLPDPVHPYAAQVEQVGESLKHREGYLVFFDRVDWRPYLGDEAQLVPALGLRRIATERDGRIYAAPRASDPRLAFRENRP